jgi:hypothetical protein
MAAPQPCMLELSYWRFAMTTNTPEQPPPHIQLIQMGAAVTSRTVCVAAKLGIADNSHLAQRVLWN